jgi:hypothetical protein
MYYKVKNIEKINFDILLNTATHFKITDINTKFHENFLQMYYKKDLIGVVNYCIINTMSGQSILYIRNIYYNDINDFDNIIKSLCKYCRKKNFYIQGSNSNNKYTSDALTILHNNNFTGDDYLFYNL